MTPQRPRKTLRPPPQKLRLRVSAQLTEQETRRLQARAKADLRSIADTVARLVEADLRKRSSGARSRVRGPNLDDQRTAYDLNMTLTVAQRERVEARAAQQGWSLSSYVAKVIVEGALLVNGVFTGREEIHSIEAPIGKLTPGQVAETIGPVVEALFEDLLMKACPIEAERL